MLLFLFHAHAVKRSSCNSSSQALHFAVSFDRPFIKAQTLNLKARPFKAKFAWWWWCTFVLALFCTRGPQQMLVLPRGQKQKKKLYTMATSPQKSLHTKWNSFKMKTVIRVYMGTLGVIGEYVRGCIGDVSEPQRGHMGDKGGHKRDQGEIQGNIGGHRGEIGDKGGQNGAKSRVLEEL